MMHEQSLIAAFVKRNKRDRYRDMLSDPRIRRQFTERLAHFRDFDPKHRVSISGDTSSVERIAIELQKRLSPSIVFAISEDPRIDGKNSRSKRASSRSSIAVWAASSRTSPDGLHSSKPKRNATF
jgi:hypothetical protein